MAFPLGQPVQVASARVPQPVAAARTAQQNEGAKPPLLLLCRPRNRCTTLHRATLACCSAALQYARRSRILRRPRIASGDPPDASNPCLVGRTAERRHRVRHQQLHFCGGGAESGGGVQDGGLCHVLVQELLVQDVQAQLRARSFREGRLRRMKETGARGAGRKALQNPDRSSPRQEGMPR